MALAAFFAFGMALLKYPMLGLMSLTGFIFLNLSQVLVRFHSLPSVLQFMLIPLAATAWIHRNRDIGIAALGNPVTVALLGYTLIVFSSTMVASDRVLADQRCLELSKALILHSLVVMLVRTRRELRRAIWTVFGAGALLASLGVWQALTGDYHSEWGGLARIKYAHIYGMVFEPRIAGPLGDPNFFAQILLLALPIGLFAAPRAGGALRRSLIPAATAVVVAGIAFSYSRGGALSLGIVLLLWALDRKAEWKNLGLGFTVLIVLLLSLPATLTRRLTTIPQIVPGSENALHPDSSFEKRKLLARAGWRIFQDHFLLGVGAANFTTHFEEYADEVGSAARDYDDPEQLRYPHNLYLEIGTETGAVGLLAFGFVLVFGGVRLVGARRKLIQEGDQEIARLARAIEVSFIGYLVSSTFLHLQYPRYLWLILAFVAALRSIPKASPPGGNFQAEMGACR